MSLGDHYVNDAFWGLWWTLGNASPAFPYDYHGGKAKFEQDFCVIEYLMGRKEDYEEHQRKRRKVLPRITNVSQFWHFDPKEFLKQPVFSRDFPPLKS